jgi:ketosteroid isomerase-like protein
MEDAFARGDARSYFSHYTEDAVGFLPDFAATLRGRAEIERTLGEVFKIPGRSQIWPSNVEVWREGDLAAVSFLWMAGEGELGRGTRLFRRTTEGWRCFYFHLSTAPNVPNPFRDEGR